MNTTWPLVGRDEELEFIAGRLGEQAAGGVVLTGGAGCGKTRVAMAVVEHARERGYATTLVVADQSTREIPLAAFAHLLDSEDLAVDDPLRLLVQTREALERTRGTARGLLLVVDDAHHLDPASAALVHQAASAQAFVVVTLRSEEVVPEPVVALWKEGLADRIELQPLSWPDLHDLLTRVLGGAVEGRTMHRLWTASRGNVMYVRELVLGGLESGSLRNQSGTWILSGPLVAPRLVDLVGARLAALPNREREALGLLAFAEPISVDLFATLVGSGTIDALERRRLIAVEDGGHALRLAHPLYGEVLTVQVPTLEARAMKERLIRALEHDPSGADPAQAIKVALWSLELGEAVDPDELLRAAGIAADPALSERLARAAVDAGGGARASATLATHLYLQAKGEEAEEVFRALTPNTDPDAAMTDDLGVRASNLFFVLGRTEPSLAALREAEASQAGARAGFELRSRRAQIQLFSGETAEAVTIATALLEDPGLPIGMAVRSAWVAGVGLALQGHSERARILVDRLTPSLDPTDDTDLLPLAHLMTARFLAAWLSGRIDEAETLAQAGYDLLGTHPRSEMHGIAALGIARVALTRGRPRDAAKRFEEAVVLLRENDTSGFVVFALSGLAQAKALSGAADAAERALQEAGHRRMAVRIFDADLELARAWTAVATGANEDAVAKAVLAADVAHGMGQGASEVVALHDAVRLGATADVAERLAGTAAAVEGGLATARADHATGVIESDADAVERASAGFEACGATLLAAECVCASARLHLDAGRGGRARAATARARRLAAVCQSARTPLLWQAGEAARLTAREREIAQLAVTGLSNREIADQLVLSLRTIENHLHQVYTKLGVAGREELEPDLVGRLS